MMQKPGVLILSGLIVGIGLGLLVAFLFLPPTDSQTGTTPRAEENLPSSDKDNDNENTASGPTNLASIIELDTASARRLALYELMEQKSGEQIADLLGQSFTMGTTHKLPSIQRLLFAALARLNPELSLELVWRSERSSWNEFFDIVLHEWASTDPQLAAQASAALEEPWKSNAFRIIFQTRHDFSDPERLELAESFDVARILNEVTIQTQINELLNEPKGAFELILQADIPAFRKSEMANRIADRWIEREGVDNIRSMLSLVHETFFEEQYEQDQWRSVVTKLAANDPKLAWEHLSTLSLDAQKMLNDEVFKVWVKLDPDSAINELNESEYMVKESEELRKLYASWAIAVWEQLPEKIGLVPESHRANMLIPAVRNLVHRIEPSVLLEQLKRIQNVGVNTLNTLEVYFVWLSAKDPVAALHWASEYMDKESHVFSTILQRLAIVDVTRAMEFVLQQPDSSRAEESVVQAIFSQGWLQQGLELLPRIRAGTGARHLYATAGTLLIENGRIAEAIALAEKFSEEDRVRYFENLARMWVFEDINEFLPVLSEIPGEERRVRVAEMILRLDSSLGNLTDDEIEIVRSYIPLNTDP